MLKLITFSGIVIGALLVLLEFNVSLFGNLLKNKRESGIPVKAQLKTIIKSRHV